MTYNCAIPLNTTPLTDPNNNITVSWYQYFLAMFNRTGAAQGVTAADFAITTVQKAADSAKTSAATALSAAKNASATANAAQSTATEGVNIGTTAQSSATTALANAASAQAIANTALTNAATAQNTANGAVSVSNFRTTSFPLLIQAFDDPTASSLGVAVGQLYVSGSTLMQRQV